MSDQNNDRGFNFRHRARGVRDALNREGNGVSIFWNWVYFIIKMATAIFTVLALIESVVVCVWVLGYDARELQTYITTTFHATNDNEAGLGWQVLTSPSWSGITRTAPYTDIKLEPYYECMWTAQVAWTVCNNDSVDAYKACMSNAYAAQLANCAVGVYNTSFWPTAQSYTKCITNTFNPGNRTILNSLRTCVGQNLWPLYEVPLDMDTSHFLGSFSWPLLMLTGFFLFTLFGVYTFYPVDFEDTAVIEHGKAGKGMGLTRLGMVWTLVPVVGAMAWVGVTLAIAFRSGSAWPNNFTNAYPSTQTTNLVIVSAAFGVLFYFLLELAEFGDRDLRKSRLGPDQPRPSQEEYDPVPELPEVPYAPDQKWNSEERRMMMAGIPQPFNMMKAKPVGYVFPDPTGTHEINSVMKAGEFYTPVLLNTWADAYLLDILFLVGAVGGTLQVVTADVYNLFWVLVYYRVAHMGVYRMMYQSYVRSPTDDAETNHIKDAGHARAGGNFNSPKERGQLAMRVLGLAFHIAAVYALYIVLYIVFNSNRMLDEYPNLIALFTLALIVPEAIRFAGHLFLAFVPSSVEGGKGVFILIAAHFLWMWDILIRAIFILIFMWGSSDIRGTKPFLVARVQNLTDTLAYMH